VYFILAQFLNKPEAGDGMIKMRRPRVCACCFWGILVVCALFSCTTRPVDQEVLPPMEIGPWATEPARTEEESAALDLPEPAGIALPEEPALEELALSEEPEAAVAVTLAPRLPLGGFDPANVSQDLFDQTLAEVQQLIDRLNRIIRARNYLGWLTYLGDDYRILISSPAFLAQASSSPFLRGRVTLGGSEDYFLQVVVPSRQNSRVDDIEFVSETRIKAYTVAGGQRLRLYELGKTENEWKIVN
jgi:hypothetical protein